jgi:methylaspartate ammonia-lyase
MRVLPQIIAVTAVPGLSPTGNLVWLGLRLADGRTAWGEWANVPDAQTAGQTVQQQVAPLLQGQPFTSFQEWMTRLDSLTEKVVVTRVVKPETAATGATISRRGLITGGLAAERPKMIQSVEERPLFPALRFALSQALLHAFALSRNSTPTAVLVEEYGLAVPETAVPLQVEATESNIALIRPILATHVAALSYDTGTARSGSGFTEHQATLGANAERLQRYVRQVKEWLTASTAAQPAIHLNLQGGFTELYANNAGKLLGALYGLEQAAKPYPLLVENVVGGDFPAVRQTLQQLHNYLHLRRMTTQLAAGYSLFAPEELRELGDGTAVHHLHLHPAQFGSLHENIQFILACQERGIGVTVHADGQMVETAVTLALITHAHTLSGRPDKIYNEMIKMLEILRY